MNQIHKQRLIFISIIVGSIAIAVALALYALQQNINLFYSPSQVVGGEAPIHHPFRLGGLVQKGSIQRPKKDLDVSFIVTDNKNKILVNYHGVLPDLFREGQAVVLEGALNSKEIFEATQVLAKHDEKYMPPAVASLLEKVRS